MAVKEDRRELEVINLTLINKTPCIVEIIHDSLISKSRRS
jgi:hypothetical protein